MIINLDENERVDEITVQGKVYLAGEVPPEILRQILDLKVWFFSFFLGKSLEERRKPIIHAYLSIRNQEVSLKYRGKTHLQSMILYIQKRIHEEYENGTDL